MNRRRSVKLWLKRQDEAVEIEHRVLVLRPVQVKVHVAGNRPCLGHRRRRRWPGRGWRGPRALRLRSRPVGWAPRTASPFSPSSSTDPRGQLPKLPLELLDPRFSRRFLACGRWCGVVQEAVRKCVTRDEKCTKNAINVRNDEPPASTVLFKTLFLIERNQAHNVYHDFAEAQWPDQINSGTTRRRLALTDTDLRRTGGGWLRRPPHTR